MEKKQLPVEVVIPADKVAFMKESIEKLRALNKSDYKSGQFDSFNHKYEGRYYAFEEVLQWSNPLKFYEEEKSILLDEMTNLSKELQQKDTKLIEAEEKIKVLDYDNKRLAGEMEGYKEAVDELKGQTNGWRPLLEDILKMDKQDIAYISEDLINKIKTFLYGE